MTTPIQESGAVGVAKAIAITTGAIMSDAPELGHVGGFVVWLLTVLYGVLQLVKAAPWFTDQSRAFWRGVRHGDWSEWWRIARRGERTADKGDAS